MAQMLAASSTIIMETAGASISRVGSIRSRDEALPPYEIFDPRDTTPVSLPSSQSSLHSPLPPLSSEQENGVIYSPSGSYFPPSPPPISTTASQIRRRPVPQTSTSSSNQQSRPNLEVPAGEVIAYFVPFPRPHVPNLAYLDIPEQFLIYMLPQPQAFPSQNEENAKKADKIRQKQLKEIIKTASKARSADAAFLSRFPDPLNSGTQPDGNEDCALEGPEKILFNDLTILYPATSKSNEKEMRTMFMNCLIEWGEGLTGNAAKMSRMLSRRLTHNCICGHHEHERLSLTIKKSTELELLSRYLAKQCREQDQRMFPHPGLMTPSEQDILDVLGWEPSGAGEETKKAKDWESIEMQGDIRTWMKKGAKEWAATCQKLSKEHP